MRKWIVAVLSVLCIAGLCACNAGEEQDGETIQIYFVNREETRVEVRDYVMTGENTPDRVHELLDALAVTPGKLEYKAPLDMGFEVLSHQLKDGVLTINVNTAYKKQLFTTEVLIRAALVASFTQIEGVSYVSITVEGQPLYDNSGMLVGAQNKDDFINNPGSQISAYDTANLTLYFANEAGDGLIAVNRKKYYNTNISLERLVVEELIEGPSATAEGVYPTVDAGARAISVLTKDGVCYVNLNAAFLNPVSNVNADVALYSLVNSLIELNNVNKVQISIDGSNDGMFREKYNLSSVFERNLDLVTTLSN